MGKFVIILAIIAAGFLFKDEILKNIGKQEEVAEAKVVKNVCNTCQNTGFIKCKKCIKKPKVCTSCLANKNWWTCGKNHLKCSYLCKGVAGGTVYYRSRSTDAGSITPFGTGTGDCYLEKANSLRPLAGKDALLVEAQANAECVMVQEDL